MTTKLKTGGKVEGVSRYLDCVIGRKGPPLNYLRRFVLRLKQIRASLIYDHIAFAFPGAFYTSSLFLIFVIIELLLYQKRETISFESFLATKAWNLPPWFGHTVHILIN